MGTLENLQYELRPYLYAFLSLYAISHYKISIVMVISGLMLAFCSYSVFSMRHRNRRQRVPTTSKIK